MGYNNEEIPRLVDVFISGPLQISIAFYLKNIFLKYFILITGIVNILYNGHNYLLFNRKLLKNPVKLFKPFIDLEHGKKYLHRVYNLAVMYPIFFYIILNYQLPIYLRIMFIINIIIGFIFNLYYFLVINYKI
jgi:hypothetical protein